MDFNIIPSEALHGVRHRAAQLDRAALPQAHTLGPAEHKVLGEPSSFSHTQF